MNDYFFVFLRRPKSLDDGRDDPFWEFGSFGTTGCHGHNLLHPNRSSPGIGDQLVFLQGGTHEVRVVGITPPLIERKKLMIGKQTPIIELRWDKTYQPLRYDKAPVLINNRGKTDFPVIGGDIRRQPGNRSTLCGAVASRFRSRGTALPEKWKVELRDWFFKRKLPSIRTFADAIQADHHSWHQDAVRKGWTTLKYRRTQYKRKRHKPAIEPLVRNCGRRKNSRSTKTCR